MLIEDSKQNTPPETTDTSAPSEATLETAGRGMYHRRFMKVDLRIAKVVRPQQSRGRQTSQPRAGSGPKTPCVRRISKAYKPEDLIGRLVVCVANLKPRKMKFGLSKAWSCRRGHGRGLLISPDPGAKPGQRVH